ncbi:MAG: hypothetical protein AB7R55_05670 [Gemmatimonadales bacterium]
MRRRGASLLGILVGLLLAGSAALVGAALMVGGRRYADRPRAEEAPPVARPVGATEPIAAEAGVFRTRLAMLAIGDPATPRRSANPRTLHSFRLRRAFPGAPPRIPHGLTTEEYRTVTCNSCHRRGGFSPRFGAYVPVTPHPEWDACLQCHVGDDEITGVVLPSHDPNTICRQCHDPTSLAETITAPEWLTSVWPQIRGSVVDGPPPPIPHDLATRNNCLACHAGPGAVAELRTSHPERADCRQCHLASSDGVGEFTRPVPERSSATGAIQ